LRDFRRDDEEEEADEAEVEEGEPDPGRRIEASEFLINSLAERDV
jgi:hypothetical protein